MRPAQAGRDSVGTRVWLGLLLWATMCVGELRLVSQSVLAMYLWIALFTLPYLYRQARPSCAGFCGRAAHGVTGAHHTAGKGARHAPSSVP